MDRVARYVRRKVSKRPRTVNTPSSSRAPSHSSSHSHSQSQARSNDSDDEEESNEPQSLVEQPTGETYGIIFVSNHVVENFLQTRNREVRNTRFYIKKEMTSLGLNEGIQLLFKNIGWEGFLKWDEVGYERPTLEVLSSCVFTDDALHFRAYNGSHSITIDQVCELAGAPTENTFYINSRDAPSLDIALFWMHITGINRFDPSRIKSSSIIHPTLRVAARILATSFFAREQAGSINTTEIILLWCMVNKPAISPNFASYLFHQLSKSREAYNSPINSSGLITKLLTALDIEIPDNEIPLQTERYIGKANLIRGSLFREGPDGVFTWLLGTSKTPHLVIKKSTFSTLKLKRPVSATNWLISSNIPTHEASGSGHPQGDEGADTSTPAPEPARHSEASYFMGLQNTLDSLNSSYQSLSGRYTSLDSNYTALQGNYSSLSGNYTALHDNYNTLNTNYSSLRNSFEASQNQYSTLADNYSNLSSRFESFQTQQSDMNNMVDTLFQWHIHEYPPPPHPPQE